MIHFYKTEVFVVGAGLFGVVMTREALDRRRLVCVVGKRSHMGSNCYAVDVDDIIIHVCSMHIFRAIDKTIWRYVERFCEFCDLPFNTNIFRVLRGVYIPIKARAKIKEAYVACENPLNLEEHILNMARRDIYEKLVKGYIEKQRGHVCAELSPSIMRCIPFWFIYDNDYFCDPYQGVPKGGYAQVIQKTLDDAEVQCGANYLENRGDWDALATLVVCAGEVDALFGYRFGPLGCRGLRFEHEKFEEENRQGVAVMNCTDAEIPCERTIEHKHFELDRKSVV